MENAAVMTHEEAGAMRRDMERIKSDLRLIRSDLGTLAHDASHVAKSGAAGAKEAINVKLHDVAEQGKKSVAAVEEQIHLHPFMAVTTALAVGMVCGMSLCRKE